MRLLSLHLLLIIGIPLVCFSQKDFQKKYQSLFILAESGDVIELPEGIFQLTNTLSLEGKKKVTIRGKGMNKTILSFKNQTDGAEVSVLAMVLKFCSKDSLFRMQKEMVLKLCM